MDNKTALPILVVDDEEIVLVALRETMTREGYKVVSSPHAVHALSLLSQQQFSVVLTDYQMPMINGLEFLSKAKELQPDATRILITAVLSLNTIIDAINKGEIYRFVVKPWLREELLVTIKNAVQRHEGLRSEARLHAKAIHATEALCCAQQVLEVQTARIAEQNVALRELENAQEQAHRDSAELCARMLQAFHPILENQARRVFELCKAIANGIALPPEQRRILEVSALIHDIGLINVPRELIRRLERAPESLDETERALFQRHPALSEEIAEAMNYAERIGPVIRAHHERFDGGGYPDKIRGENIPWLARLLAVAVAYAESDLDAKTVSAMIAAGSGTRFDPEAVRIFLRFLPKTVVPGRQRELLISELRPGMKLAEGIYTASGILVIPDGQRLTLTSIDKLRDHHREHPASKPLLVYC